MFKKIMASDTPFTRFLQAFFGSRLATFGFVLLLLLLLAALLAPLIAPQNPYDLEHLDIMDSRLEPGKTSMDGLTYLLGTDDQGRDMLSAILYGLRISVMVGVSSTVIALAIGLSLGLLAGYAGGRLEALIMRVADIQLAFPPILVALILLALTGRGVDKIITMRGPRAVPRWSSARRNTSKRRVCWACHHCASCSAICCRTACRR